MTGEEIFYLIMILGVCFGCGCVFFSMGLWAEKSKKPFGFWTGKEVKPETIRDIPAYNRENGRMWKQYSVPYFLACIFAVAGIWLPHVKWVPIALIVGACTLGIVWLILRYKRILQKYSR